MESTDIENRLKKIGLDPNVIKNTLANPKVTASMLHILDLAEVTECNKKTGNHLLNPIKMYELKHHEYRQFALYSRN